MRTEIYIDNYRLDLTKEISAEFTYAIDEIQDFATRNTSFSKTIVLPGNDTNNKLFGNIFEFGNSNLYNPAEPNVGYNFNATKSVPCIILVDKIQIFKGVLRLLEIIIDDRSIEYEVAVFGELGGFITALGNNKLEDIDFGIADQTWNVTNIANSWDNISGTGVYYPLIDNGNVSTNKIDFSFDAFRPALYVKQYLTKILDGSGYTYDFPLLSTALMNRLVIPNNQKTLTKSTSSVLIATAKVKNYINASGNVEFDIVNAGNFTITGSGSDFTYNSGTAFSGSIYLSIAGVINAISPTSDFTIQLRKNGTPISGVTYTTPGNNYNFNADLSVALVTLVNTDTLDVDLVGNFSGTLISVMIEFSSRTITEPSASSCSPAGAGTSLPDSSTKETLPPTSNLSIITFAPLLRTYSAKDWRGSADATGNSPASANICLILLIASKVVIITFGNK